ncbi:hypothetical protein SALBM217S_02062 [Streptomyces griseoloalbus]
MVVGAGPAGLTVGCVLRAAGVDCLVLETETREFVEGRPRAGVIEEPVVRGLERRGLAGNLLERARRDTACEFRFDGERHRFGFHELTGRHHWVYPQQLLVTDLVREYTDVRGGAVRFGVRDVRLHGRWTPSASPILTTVPMLGLVRACSIWMSMPRLTPARAASMSRVKPRSVRQRLTLRARDRVSRSRSATFRPFRLSG